MEMPLNWNRKDLESLPAKGNVIHAGDERIERYSEDAMMRGSPDAVLVARDDKEVAEVIAYCNAKLIPVTFCGSQTSETGSSVALEGLIISTEKLEGVTEISDHGGEPVAIVRPGTITADFQRAVSDAGFFYPVAPTSRDECRIGANIATNASGEDSYKYGPVRQYIRELEIILADGSRRVLKREPKEKPSAERNRAGFFTGWKNPIDLVIGSEGTLGFVSKAIFAILPAANEFFSALIPFSLNSDAISFASDIMESRLALSPRALELIDKGALELMRTAQGFPKIADEINAFLYIKQEYKDLSEKDALLAKWYEETAKRAGEKLSEYILIADTPREQEDFRLWRHRIPELSGEIGRGFWADGGAKIGSDWWVPTTHIRQMMDFFYKLAEATGLQHMGYAHIGVGNPHTNIIAKNAKEKKLALDVLTSCCKKTVELGGGVAGEHGLGKLHADLLSIQHPPEAIEKMRKWKREYDPNWILGRGNIFEAES